MNDDAELSQLESSRDEEPLYVDEQGVPMLFDVVLPGDRVQQAGISLEAMPVGKRVPVTVDSQDLDQRIKQAIDEALPKVSERTASRMRDALLKEVRSALSDSETP